MPAAANMVEVAALVGDTARATMLAALMGGQALTASELADLAQVTRATASGHLAKLAAARLVAATSQRRFRYYRLASPLVAQMLESIKLVAALEVPPRYQPRSARDDAERFARTCYDHIAGRIGVAIADALVASGAIVLAPEGGEVTTAGARLLTAFGAALEVPPRFEPRSARDDAERFARTCYDHLAGRLGVAIADALAASGAVVLSPEGGEVTAAGARLLAAFGVALAAPTSRRIFCRPCLDWSERRYHVAGHVGAEICRRCFELGWVQRRRDSRALRLTPIGAIGLAETFGVSVADEGGPAAHRQSCPDRNGILAGERR